MKNRGLFPVPNWSPRKVVKPEQQLCGIYAWDLSKENYHSKPSLLSIKGVLGMARAGIFQISLLCIFSFVPGGGRAPLNSFWRFFFSIRWQLTELLNLLQRASVIGLLRKQPGKKVGWERGRGGNDKTIQSQILEKKDTQCDSDVSRAVCAGSPPSLL